LEAALNDDLNTPRAFTLLAETKDQLREALNRGDRAEIGRLREVLVRCGGLIGFLQVDPDAWFQGGVEGELKTRVETLIALRAEARKAKDWALADRIRTELNALKVEVLDGPGGTATWRLRD
jgi:cysteinyl-tRNA synthetase